METRRISAEKSPLVPQAKTEDQDRRNYHSVSRPLSKTTANQLRPPSSRWRSSVSTPLAAAGLFSASSPPGSVNVATFSTPDTISSPSMGSPTNLQLLRESLNDIVDVDTSLHLRDIISLSIISFVVSLDWALMMPTLWLFISWSLKLGTGYGFYGSLLSIYEIMATAGGAFCTYGVDRFESVTISRLLVVSLLLGSLGYFMLIIADVWRSSDFAIFGERFSGHSVWLVFTSRSLSGFASGAVVSLSQAHISRITSDHNRSLILGKVASIRLFALLCGPFFSILFAAIDIPFYARVNSTLSSLGSTAADVRLERKEIFRLDWRNLPAVLLCLLFGCLCTVLACALEDVKPMDPITAMALAAQTPSPVPPAVNPSQDEKCTWDDVPGEVTNAEKVAESKKKKHSKVAKSRKPILRLSSSWWAAADKRNSLTYTSSSSPIASTNGIISRKRGRGSLLGTRSDSDGSLHSLNKKKKGEYDDGEITDSVKRQVKNEDESGDVILLQRVLAVCLLTIFVSNLMMSMMDTLITPMTDGAFAFEATENSIIYSLMLSTFVVGSAFTNAISLYVHDRYVVLVSLSALVVATAVMSFGILYWNVGVLEFVASILFVNFMLKLVRTPNRALMSKALFFLPSSRQVNKVRLAVKWMDFLGAVMGPVVVGWSMKPPANVSTGQTESSSSSLSSPMQGELRGKVTNIPIGALLLSLLITLFALMYAWDQLQELQKDFIARDHCAAQTIGELRDRVRRLCLPPGLTPVQLRGRYLSSKQEENILLFSTPSPILEIKRFGVEELRFRGRVDSVRGLAV